MVDMAGRPVSWLVRDRDRYRCNENEAMYN